MAGRDAGTYLMATSVPVPVGLPFSSVGAAVPA
jgi:hypothetical protein